MGIGIGAADDAGVVLHIRAAFFEVFKIVNPLKRTDGVDDRVSVELGDEGDEIGFKRVGDTLSDDVAVGALFCTEAGMKIGINDFDTVDSQGGGELEIEHLF